MAVTSIVRAVAVASTPKSEKTSAKPETTGTTAGSRLEMDGCMCLEALIVVDDSKICALGVVHDSDMFIFGGYDGRDGNYFNDLYYFNFDDQRWNQMPSVVEDRPEARTDHIMVLHSSSIYIFGGYNGSSRFNDLCGYDIEAKRWNRLQAAGAVPSRRFGHSGVVHESTNRLIIFGGWDGRDTLNDLFEYNFVTNEWRKLETSGNSPPHRTLRKEANRINFHKSADAMRFHLQASLRFNVIHGIYFISPFISTQSVL
ncbi:hypothetical protein BBJ29_008242 [Phytophthora kernoviae]|uniref:Uncharacterized protein n=1 Tax=Phytophthora kernoviae TaxID=325452 RepID=A0A3F2RD72_9STRA|nr:hypothetical protein BBP00_00009236 [Phytophthora kernoviae]RLN60673.1 hypothetical protein BBJ29_008242 [Phytophthora kernoviae]